MRLQLLALLCATVSSATLAEPLKKEQLLQPPAAARHYTISSAAGKHGDIWSWTMPDGKLAYRMSMSLRGWITETDQQMRLGPDGRPTLIQARGYTDQGDASEEFTVDGKGMARWKTAVDEGSAPIGDKRYSNYGGPWLAIEQDIYALVKAGAKGIDLLPGGHASITIGKATQIEGPGGPKTVKLAYVNGIGFSPWAVWLDANNRYFGSAGGMSLLPGLWDSHLHVGGDDWNLLQNVATGITNYRSPGSEIPDSLSLIKRRAAGDLLAPDGKIAVIIDRKDPLAAQGSLTVSSEQEAIAAVRKIKDAGLWGAKFYTSMTPAWIAPAAAEAHRLGLHVNGHVPAGMRPLDVVRAGYDEITHINFIMMQAMPQDVVDKANTAARLEGPAKYGKDVDLDSPEMQAFYKELSERKTIVDPTLSVWEPSLTSDGSAITPAYAPFADISPPAASRSWKISGYPLFDGLTRADFKASFAKMVGLVGRLQKAGVRILAGTDGWGLELVRELELYQKAGLSNEEALQTATILPARVTGMDNRLGSIDVGKTASLILVNGDASQDLANLRHINTVFLDGYRLDGAELRKASGFSGAPK